MTAVRYQLGGDNSLLKVALLEGWKWRCSWCREPVTFHDADIDHLIPHTWAQGRVEEALRHLAVRAPFIIHDPSNLAPIHHAPCNTQKSDRDFVHYSPFVFAFQRASELAAQVTAKVKILQTDRSLSRAGAVLLSADITRADAREQVETYTRSLSSALWGPQDVRWVEAIDARGGRQTIMVDMANDETQAAVSILDKLWPLGLHKLAEEGLQEIWEEARCEVTDHLDGMEVIGLDPISAEEADAHYVSTVIDAVTFKRDGADFTFAINGQLEAEYSASLVVQSPLGDGLLDTEQGDASLFASFHVEAQFSAESEHGDSYDLLDCVFRDLTTEYWTTLDRFAAQAFEEEQHELMERRWLEAKGEEFRD